MHKESTGNILLYFCVLVNGLARFLEIKRNVKAAELEKYILVEEAREHPDVSNSGKEALTLVMCMDH